MGRRRPREIGVDVRVGDTGTREHTRIGFDRATHCVFVDRSSSGFAPEDTHFAGRRSVTLPVRAAQSPLRLRIFVDASSLEVFVNGGEVVITEQIFPSEASTGIALYATAGSAIFSLVEC